MNKDIVPTLCIFFSLILTGCSSSQTFFTKKELSSNSSSNSPEIATSADELDYPPVDQITPDPNLSLEILEQRLLGGWIDSAYGGYWTAKQSEDAVPLIEEMFTKIDAYGEQQEEGGELMGIFPYNAIYALAHIDSPKAKTALEKCIDEEFNLNCQMALEAWEYRHNHLTEVGEAGVARAEMVVYEQSDASSKQITTLYEGDKVIILESGVENQNEGGFRGGYMSYFQVKLIDSGEVGYIQQNPDSIFQFI